MLYFVFMYVGLGTLLLMFYAWHEYTEGGELVGSKAESTDDRAREEAR